eukprot:3323603-Rhodomonas_salina.1
MPSVALLHQCRALSESVERASSKHRASPSESVERRFSIEPERKRRASREIESVSERQASLSEH